jgi:hypothetical protein
VTPWSPRRTLAAALALIVVANTFVLAGVAYNRSGEPEAVLQLSERELTAPREWGFSSEKSGIGLDLKWRVPLTPKEYQRRGHYAYDYGGGGAEWLTAAKLAELGFDLPALRDAERSERYERERQVFLVLEMDGSAYQAALEAARVYAADNTATKEAAAARQRIEREETSSSRLFAVDAGLDARQLRARYPDRTRYAVVAGRVRPWIEGREGQWKYSGYISAVSVGRVNVPYALRLVFDSLPPTRTYAPEIQLPRFEATLAYGQRLEPWLVSAGRLEQGK